MIKPEWNKISLRDKIGLIGLVSLLLGFISTLLLFLGMIGIGIYLVWDKIFLNKDKSKNEDYDFKLDKPVK